MVTLRSEPSQHVVARVRDDFADAELGTALWLLRECVDDDERMAALLDADGDLATLVLAIEDRIRTRRLEPDR